MELEFTPDQDELRDAVRAVLVRECPMSLVREVVEKGIPADGLWAQMVALGWPALTVPEDHGGLGFGMVELAVVLEELGRVDAPGPFLATVSRYVPLVQEAGSAAQHAELLPPVAAGERTGTIAVAPDGVTAEPTGAGYRLRGTAAIVADPGADDVAVVARVTGHADLAHDVVTARHHRDRGDAGVGREHGFDLHRVDVVPALSLIHI